MTATPWATGLTVAGFVAAVTAARGRRAEPRVDPRASAAGRRAQPGGRRRAGTDGVGWRRTPVWRWFVLGLGVGVAGAWLALLTLILS